MEIKKIYFDMDGVLADFDRGTRELCGLPVIPQGEQSPAEVDELFGRMAKIPHYYGRLEPIEGALEMFRRVYEQYGDRCEILTGVPKANRRIYDASEDKKQWIAEKLGSEIVVNTCLRADKVKFCGGKEYLLIDDYSLNIKEWERFGGTGILFSGVEDLLARIKDIEDK